MAQTATSKAMTACEKVFNMVELLDIVLSHIVNHHNSILFCDCIVDCDPLHEIFLLQKVNKTFYNHIHGSTITAQKLYSGSSFRHRPIPNVESYSRKTVYSVMGLFRTVQMQVSTDEAMEMTLAL
jgi:hypothetical protein